MDMEVDLSEGGNEVHRGNSGAPLYETWNNYNYMRRMITDAVGDFDSNGTCKTRMSINKNDPGAYNILVVALNA